MNIETLDTTGFLMNNVRVKYALLVADFGDGFESGAIIGNLDGQRFWSMKIDVVPDDTTSGAGLIEGETRAEYLWNFFQRSKAAANQPFWFLHQEPGQGEQLFLASFIDDELSFDILCAKIYSSGLQLKQRRLEDIVSPVTPGGPTDLVAQGISSAQINLSWTDNSTDETSFKVERKTTGGSFAEVASVGPNVTTWSDTGLDPESAFIYRVRAYATGKTYGYSNEDSAQTFALPHEPEVYASFFAEDSDTDLPDTETGETWVQLLGDWGIDQYQARLVTSEGDTENVAYIETGQADCNLQVQVTKFGINATAGIAFRVTNVNNRYFARLNSTGSVQLFKEVAGSITGLGSWSGTMTSGDWIRVELSGTSIKVKHNGVVRISVTDSFNQTATKHGLHCDEVALTRMKHFSMDQETNNDTDWVTVSTPHPFQIFQRDGSDLADIPISGSFSGSPAAIEAQFAGQGWATIDASPGGGTFSGTLSAQLAAQGYLEVRFTNDHTTIWRVPYVGVGDVFLVIGQSNAEGRLFNHQYYTHASLRAGVFAEDDVWREAFDDTDSDAEATDGGATHGSVWPLLATEIMAEADVPVAFITVGHGDTALQVSPADWAQGNTRYNLAVAQVAASGANGLKAILFHQGEFDANTPASVNQAAYEQAVKDLQTDLSTDLGFGNLPLVIAQIAYWHTPGGLTHETRASVDAVRIAQSLAADTDSDVVLGPVLYDLDISENMSICGPFYCQDGRHIMTDAHAQIVADRWWHTLKFLFYGGSEGRGPQFLSATRVDSTHIDVQFTLSGSAHLMAGSPPTTGWKLSGGPTAVSAATRQSNDTVRLTVTGGSVVAGTTKVSWASYNDAVGQVLTDNTADAMPAEPFVDKTVS